MTTRNHFSTQTAAWSFALSISGRFHITNYGFEAGRLDCFFIEFVLPEGRRAPATH